MKVNKSQLKELKIVLKAVEFVFGMGKINPGRVYEHVRARQIFYKLSQETGKHKSLAVIGSIWNKDHATVLHALNNFEAQITLTAMNELYLQAKLISDTVFANTVKEREDLNTIEQAVMDNNILKGRNIELEMRIQELEDENSRSVDLDDNINREFFSILKSLSYDEKIELLFKAKTMLKVKKVFAQ